MSDLHGELVGVDGSLSDFGRAVRHRIGLGIALGNGLLRRTPVGVALHQRLHEGRELTTTSLPLFARHAALAGLRVAFLSDLHAGHFMGAEDLVDVALEVRSLEPHLIALGGDLIDGRRAQIRLYDEALRILRPPLGVFAVPGNHEYYRKNDVDYWTSYLEERGVRVLTNTGVRLSFGGASFWLCGVDDLVEGRPDLDAALAGRDPGELTLLLSHHPDVFAVAADRGVDVQLSGHTHGGQIRVLGWSPILHSRYGWYQGRFQLGASQLYVGRGVGATVFPLRVGAPAEVSLLRLVAPGPKG